MAKQVASYRIDADLLEWLGEYAKSRGASQGVIVEKALESFRADTQSGVPDLPVAVAPKLAKPKASPKREPTQRDYNLTRQEILNAAKYRRAS